MTEDVARPALPEADDAPDGHERDQAHAAATGPGRHVPADADHKASTHDVRDGGAPRGDAPHRGAHRHDVPGGPAGTPPRRQASRLLLLLIGLVVVLIVLVVVEGLMARSGTYAQLKVVTDEEAVPKVHVISPKSETPTRSLDLPGVVAAWYATPIYAQVSGYVQAWDVDFGANIRKGEILATIDTPYLDQQLTKAKANLAVEQSRLKLARVTARRWQSLSGTQAVSQQEVDVYTSGAETQAAAVAAAEANVQRFEAREAFKQVRAPFDGVVTDRSTDIGDFVNAAGGDEGAAGPGPSTPSSQLFRVADISRIRIFVSVPQDYSGYMKPGVKVTFTVDRAESRTYDATLLTTARAVNTDTRTVVTELVAANQADELWPGTYATVHFSVVARTGKLLLPAQAVLFRPVGLTVAVVDANNEVHFRTVKAGLNEGAQIEIVQGLQPSDRVVANPSEGLQDGEKVDIVSGG